MEEKIRQKLWRWGFVGGCILLGLALLYMARTVIGPFAVAFVLAYLLNPLVAGLERHKISRNLGIALVFVGIVLLFSITLFIILPVLYNELSKLSGRLPEIMDGFNQQVLQLRARLNGTGLPSQVLSALDRHMSKTEGGFAGYLERVLDSLPQILSSLTYYLLSPVMAIYFLADWKRMNRWFLNLVPGRLRIEWQRLWQDISHVLRRFIRGNLVVAVIVGVLIGVGVKLVGMDYALLIGLICGIFDLIPYFGPFIGAAPSILLGLTKSTWMAVEIGLIILVVQQLEGNFISPKLMGESVGLHPLWVVFALLAGESIAGFWGMLIAVPLAAVLRVVFRYIYLRLVAPDGAEERIDRDEG